MIECKSAIRTLLQPRRGEGYTLASKKLRNSRCKAMRIVGVVVSKLVSFSEEDSRCTQGVGWYTTHVYF